jgi:hypothetical protein
MNTDTTARRPFRRHGAVALSGIAVLLAFAWLATTACMDDEGSLGGGGPAGPAPPPPEDQGIFVDMRDDVRIRNDGSMSFVQYSPDGNTSTVLCDSRTGTGSSDKAAQERMKSALEAQADAHKREVEAIDRLLKSCEGKPQSDVAILAAHGCSEVQETKLGEAAHRILQHIESLEQSIRSSQEMVRFNVQQINELTQSGKDDKATQGRLKMLADENSRQRQLVKERQAQLDYEKSRLPAAMEAAERMQQACNTGREARSKEPCAESNLRFHRNRRGDLVAKGAQYKHLAESFKECVKRVAQSERPATRRETMDPGTVMQVLPGILGSGRPSRPSRSAPPPSHHSD